IQPLQVSLAPIERAGDFSGRVNGSGYRTQKIFKDSSKANGYVQVYRTGQIESVRIIQADNQKKLLFGDLIDNDIIHAVWSYSTALAGLGIPLPIVVSLGFFGLKGYI